MICVLNMAKSHRLCLNVGLANPALVLLCLFCKSWHFPDTEFQFCIYSDQSLSYWSLSRWCTLGFPARIWLAAPFYPQLRVWGFLRSTKGCKIAILFVKVVQILTDPSGCLTIFWHFIEVLLCKAFWATEKVNVSKVLTTKLWIESFSIKGVSSFTCTVL